MAAHKPEVWQDEERIDGEKAALDQRHPLKGHQNIQIAPQIRLIDLGMILNQPQTPPSIITLIAIIHHYFVLLSANQ